MDLSIIVPMYNVENYIEECLLSLINQTISDKIEIIIVNDGSTDSSVEIVNKYISKYPNLIKLVNKKNGGLSDARNFGIQYAKNEYIAFLDSDDYVENTTYEKMLNKIKEGYDIVVCDIRYFFDKTNKEFKLNGLCQWDIDNISKKSLLSPMFAWNKIYRLNYFKKINEYYPKNLWYEDIPVTTLLFASTNKIGYCNDTYINYRQREGSIMSSNKSKRLYEIFEIMKLVRNNFKDRNLYDKYKEELEYLHIEHLKLYGMFRFIRSNYLKELYNKSEECMKEYFPDWKNNKYISNLSTKNKIFLKYFNKYTSFIFKLFIK